MTFFRTMSSRALVAFSSSILPRLVLVAKTSGRTEQLTTRAGANGLVLSDHMSILSSSGVVCAYISQIRPRETKRYLLLELVTKFLVMSARGTMGRGRKLLTSSFKKT